GNGLRSVKGRLLLSMIRNDQSRHKLHEQRPLSRTPPLLAEPILGEGDQDTQAARTAQPTNYVSYRALSIALHVAILSQNFQGVHVQPNQDAHIQPNQVPQQ